MAPKSKCQHCLRRTSKFALMQCDACSELFCTGCLQPESHSCSKLNEKVGAFQKRLEDNLSKLPTNKGLDS